MFHCGVHRGLYDVRMLRQIQSQKRVSQTAGDTILQNNVSIIPSMGSMSSKCNFQRSDIYIYIYIYIV